MFTETLIKDLTPKDIRNNDLKEKVKIFAIFILRFLLYGLKTIIEQKDFFKNVNAREEIQLVMSSENDLNIVKNHWQINILTIPPNLVP